MRLFVFSLLAIAAVSAVPAEDRNGSLSSASLRQKRESNKNTEQHCEARKMFKKFCNTCICTADGKKTICTNNECIEGEYTENGDYKDYDPNVKHYCPRDEHYTINCNHCWCQSNGITTFCTKDTCDDPACEPNKVTRTGCKECTCSADGHQLMCYSKYCPDPIFD